MRNPKDTLCSCFAFLKTVGVLADNTDWNEFVTNFVNGTGTLLHYVLDMPLISNIIAFSLFF